MSSRHFRWLAWVLLGVGFFLMHLRNNKWEVLRRLPEYRPGNRVSERP